MKSEVIYRYSVRWRGRYGDEYEKEIFILSDFDDPTAWPYQIKRIDTEIPDSFYDEDGEEKQEKETVRRIPKEIFEKIKQAIAANKDLVGCKEHIENSVYDGEAESFDFCCDAFSKHIYGTSILYIGNDELKGQCYEKTDNAIVRKAVNDINEILEQAGISIED